MRLLLNRYLAFLTIFIVYSLLAREVFSLSPSLRQFYIEFPTLLLLFYLFGGFQKQRWLGIFLFGILTVFFYLAHDVFFHYYNKFPRFSDFDSVNELVSVLPLQYTVILLIGITSWSVATLKNTFLAGRIQWTKLILFLLIILALSNPPAQISVLADKFWPKNNFEVDFSVKNMGRLTVMVIDKSRMAHGKFLLRQLATTGRNIDRFSGFEIQSKRNVHLVVLESFFDITLLKNITFTLPPTRNSLEAKLHELENVSISPSYGGGTPNAEFEVLCGLPSLAIAHSLEFEVFTGSRTDCLPTILGKQGYLTVASHPYSPNTFNRERAYRSLGFSKRLFATTNNDQSDSFLKMDDLDDLWLFDGSLYRQNLVMVTTWLKEDKPLLNYVLTAGGHYPFLLNKSRRPMVVSANNSSDDINRLANHYYYRSKALAWYLSQLQQIDPDSLIIGVADHLPPHLDLKGLGYEARISKDPYLQIRENIVFMIDKGQWQQFGRIRHKDLFYFILDRLTNHQFCKEVDCFLRDLRPTGNITRYIEDYYAIASQAMR
jgi:phosphoglycerol transferase MdoB-like AlkP superfamily enzyme